MELQSQHGPGGSLVVIQQPSLAALEGRLQRAAEYELHHQQHHHHHVASTTPTILSLDQIKAIRSSNEYTEGPSVVRRPPSAPHRGQPSSRTQDKQERTHEVILVNVNNNYERRPSSNGHHHNATHHHPHHVGGGVVVVSGGGGGSGSTSRVPDLRRSTSTGSAVSSGSNSSASSEQGLLVRSPPSRPSGVSMHQHHRAMEQQQRPVRTQPKPNKALLSQQQKLPNVHPLPPLLDAPLKPPSSSSLGLKGKSGMDLSGKGGKDLAGLGPAAGAGHQFICERCAKCKCSDCTAPRSLPSCLACGGQCLCSAESALEHGTCMCLVKGIFYHCAGDEDDADQGDSCADHPCSLSRSHCCSRFLCMGLMSALFPCLLCYPPVKGCLKACQGCYDRVNRPGCRCKNSNTVYCKLESWGAGADHHHHHRTTQEKPS